MTGTELLAVIGGLVLGYWLVAVLLPGLARPNDDDSDDRDGSPADDEEQKERP